jgi:AcrR family transcriptional regulator
MVAKRVSGPGRPVDEELRQRRREEILAVAARLFARDGYSATDLDVVAREVGVGKGTIYRYFQNKADLFLATVDDAMCGMDDHVQRVALSSMDPLEQMTLAVYGYLVFFRRNPHVVELLIQERAVFRDHRKSMYFQHLERNVGPWRELINVLVRDGRVRDVPVERIIKVFSDMLYGTMFASYFARRDKSVDEHFHDVVDVAMRGVLTPTEETRWSEDAISRLAALAKQASDWSEQGSEEDGSEPAAEGMPVADDRSGETKEKG